MVPAWYIQAKKDGLPEEAIRKLVESFCRESDKQLRNVDTAPDPLWVDMMLHFFEAAMAGDTPS